MVSVKDIVERFVRMDIFDLRYGAVPYRFFSWSGLLILFLAYTWAYSFAYNQDAAVAACIGALASGGNVVNGCPNVVWQLQIIIGTAIGLAIALAIFGRALGLDNPWKLVDDAVAGAILSLLLLTLAQAVIEKKEYVGEVSGEKLYVLVALGSVLIMLALTVYNRGSGLDVAGLLSFGPLFVMAYIFAMSFLLQLSLLS